MASLMDAFESRELTVTLEMPDGQTWQGKAQMATISIDTPFHAFGDRDRWTGPPQWTMDLVGIGDMTFTQRDDFIERAHSAVEWQCQYCGAVMTREHRKCSACGGWRSFVYDM